jgi:hypothetical protein
MVKLRQHGMRDHIQWSKARFTEVHRLRPGDLEGLTITPPPRMSSPGDHEWEHSESLCRSHSVDDLEELRLSAVRKCRPISSRVEIEHTCRVSECKAEINN